MGEACHTGKRSLCEASQCQDVHKGRWQRSQNGDLLCRSINARMQSHYSSLLESKLGSLMHLVKCLCLPPSLDSPASRGAHYNSFVTKANKAVPEPTESEAGSLDLQGAGSIALLACLAGYRRPVPSLLSIWTGWAMSTGLSRACAQLSSMKLSTDLPLRCTSRVCTCSQLQTARQHRLAVEQVDILLEPLLARARTIPGTVYEPGRPSTLAMKVTDSRPLSSC